MAETKSDDELPALCPVCKRNDGRPNYQGRCEDCYVDGLGVTVLRGFRPKRIGSRQDASWRGIHGQSARDRE